MKKTDPLRHPILGAYGTSIVGMAPTVPPFASPSSMTCPTHTLLATTLELFITGTNIRSQEQKFPGTFVLGSRSSQWSSRSENTGQWKVPIPSSWCCETCRVIQQFWVKECDILWIWPHLHIFRGKDLQPPPSGSTFLHKAIADSH